MSSIPVNWSKEVLENYHHYHSVIGSFNFRCHWNWPQVLPITASNFCWAQVTKLIWMVARSYSWEEAPSSNLICVISYADGSAISVRLLTRSQSDAKTKAKSVLIRRMQDVKHLGEPVLISSLHRPVPWDQHSTWPRNLTVRTFSYWAELPPARGRCCRITQG